VVIDAVGCPTIREMLVVPSEEVCDAVWVFIAEYVPSGREGSLGGGTKIAGGTLVVTCGAVVDVWLLVVA